MVLMNPTVTTAIADAPRPDEARVWELVSSRDKRSVSMQATHLTLFIVAYHLMEEF